MNQITYSGSLLGSLAALAFCLLNTTESTTQHFFIPLPEILRQGVVLGAITSPHQEGRALLTIIGSAMHPANDKTTAFVARITHDDLLDSQFGSGGLVWLEKVGEVYSRATEINLIFNQYHVSVTSTEPNDHVTTITYVLDLAGSLVTKY